MQFCNKISKAAQFQQYCMAVQNCFQIYGSADASIDGKPVHYLALVFWWHQKSFFPLPQSTKYWVLASALDSKDKTVF